MSQIVANGTYVRGEFLGDQCDGRAGRLADAEREVPGLAAHGDDDVPAPRGLRVLHQVADQLHADVARGLEAERGHVRRQRQVVVDRLRDVRAADGAARTLADVARRERRVVAADRHQVRDAEPAQRLDHRPGRLWRLGRVLARRAEDRPTEQVDARDVVDGERPQSAMVAAHEVLEPVADADDFKPWLIASMVAAEMTALMPGAGPPPTRMPRQSGAPICRDSRGPVRRCQTASPMSGRREAGPRKGTADPRAGGLLAHHVLPVALVLGAEILHQLDVRAVPVGPRRGPRPRVYSGSSIATS